MTGVGSSRWPSGDLSLTRDLASSMGDTELGRSSVFSPTARGGGKGRSTGRQAARAKYGRLCEDRPVAMLHLLPVLR